MKKPRLAATRVDGGWILNGAAPWVTGGVAADLVVIGATVVQDDQPTSEELMLALPTSQAGVKIPEPFQLVGVSASGTGPVELNDVVLGDEFVLAGPIEQVMLSRGARNEGARTGGYETSTLAFGVASAALDFIGAEAAKRSDLASVHAKLAADGAQLKVDLLGTASGKLECSNESLRTRANSYVLRTTQAALAAAKGAGYLANHPVGRWCREALFFMVWSCPQPVMQANLCELAGIE